MGRMFVSGICLAFSLLTVFGRFTKNRIVLSSSHLSPISETQLEVEIYETEGVLVDLSEAQIEWGDVYGKLQFSNEDGARATASAVDKDGLALDMTRITANVTLVDGSEFGVSTFAKIFRPWGEKLTPMPRNINMDMGTAPNFTMRFSCPKFSTENYFRQEVWLFENGEQHIPDIQEAFWKRPGVMDILLNEETEQVSFNLSPWLHYPPHVSSTQAYKITPLPGNLCGWGLEWLWEDYDKLFVNCWSPSEAQDMMYIFRLAGRFYWETDLRWTVESYFDYFAFPSRIQWSFDQYAPHPTVTPPAGCLL